MLGWNAVTCIWNHTYWIYFLCYAFYVLLSPLYFTFSAIIAPLQPAPLHSDMLTSLEYAHYNFSGLVFIHLTSLHFYWLCSPPSDHIWPIHYSCSISDLINSVILTLSQSSLHCLLGLCCFLHYTLISPLFSLHYTPLLYTLICSLHLDMPAILFPD